MSSRSRFDLPLAVLILTVIALFAGKLWFADSAIYTDVITDRVLLVLGASIKIASLWCGAVFALRSARAFPRGESMRLGWALASAWLASWAVGQSVLGVYQLGLSQSAPFPSAADPFFVLGYPAMLLAFVVILRAYLSTGMVGTAQSLLWVGALAGVPFLLLAVWVLRPVLSAGGPPLELFLNVAYPSLDILALMPTVMLARVALRLAGGALFWVWTLMAAGIAFTVAGDLLYSWFSLLNYSAVDPLLDASYVLAYALVARGAYQQVRVSARVAPTSP